jgi:hypothetical protein
MVAADETATEIDVWEVMLFRMQVCDLANVVGDRIQQAPGDVLGFEEGVGVRLFRGAGDEFFVGMVLEGRVATVFCVAFRGALHLVDFAERGSDVGALEADFVVCGAVDVADEEVNGRVVAAFRELEHVFEVACAGEEGE